MSEKKVVSRGVAIGLGMICILLVIGLVGIFAYYSMNLNNKNSAYDDYVSSHSHTNSEYDNYIANHHHTDNEYNDLNDTVNLAKFTVWINDQTVSQPASSYTHWTFSANYAGYISVWVQTSTTDKTYVRVIYSSGGVDYDKQIGVGTSGAPAFPILPTSSIEIRVGNSNLINGATETVYITYHY